MKIAILCPDDFSVWHFYKGLLKALKGENFDVYVISQPGEYVKYIQDIGVVHIPVQVSRFINPIKDLKLLFKLYRIFRSYHFDIVHNLYLKFNVYGAIAARVGGAKNVFGTLEGLGFTYVERPGLKVKLLKPLIEKLCRFGCTFSDRVSFANGDDLSFFVSKKIIAPQKAILTKGHGIDLTEYSDSSIDSLRVESLQKELEINNLTKIVTMIVARVIFSKGVKEFIEASEMLRDRYPYVKFVLVGQIEKDSPQAVPEEYLGKKVSKNFKWLYTFRRDVREIIFLSDIVVLPSYYREGIPTALLEGMAMGKPIVTTNNVGCRETVEDGKNGYLIPVKDPKALADAIEVLIKSDKKRAEFGRYSRLKVEREFNQEIVIERIMKELYEL